MGYKNKAAFLQYFAMSGEVYFSPKLSTCACFFLLAQFRKLPSMTSEKPNNNLFQSTETLGLKQMTTLFFMISAPVGLSSKIDKESMYYLGTSVIKMLHLIFMLL